MESMSNKINSDIRSVNIKLHLISELIIVNIVSPLNKINNTR